MKRRKLLAVITGVELPVKIGLQRNQTETEPLIQQTVQAS